MLEDEFFSLPTQILFSDQTCNCVFVNIAVCCHEQSEVTDFVLQLSHRVKDCKTASTYLNAPFFFFFCFILFYFVLLSIQTIFRVNNSYELTFILIIWSYFQCYNLYVTFVFNIQCSEVLHLKLGKNFPGSKLRINVYETFF